MSEIIFAYNRPATKTRAVVTDTSPLPISGGSFESVVAFARTADTNIYGAGDVIGINAAGSPGSAIHTFTNAGIAGQGVLVTGADLRIDLAAVPSGMTSFRLYLYNASPTAILDNAAWDFVAGDRSVLSGYIDFSAIYDLGATLFCQAEVVNKQVQLAAGSSSIYGELVTNGAYTPASGTTFEIRLRAIGC